MTAGQSTPSQHTTLNQGWQVFFEFRLSLESGTSLRVTDLVVGTVEALHWPVEPLEQLRLALVKAVQNTVAQNHLNHLDLPLVIRAFVLETGEAGQPAGWPGDEPKQPQWPGGMVRPVRWSPSRGWGFFLVQMQGDASSTATGAEYHLIELFLYQES
ncbi:MAG: hypothetical protein BroJett011_72180 [Chloroflexota bacterium]|nr:MAG: hypothetical protein BroJett011_72180 [Chloroflexota bacterium]